MRSCNLVRDASSSANTPPAIFKTSSKLEHFLQAAERNGIPGVVSFHSMLLKKGHGPDIMHLVGVGDLLEGVCLEVVER